MAHDTIHANAIRRKEPESNLSPAMLRIEIDSQIATAKQYPREIAKCKDDMLSMATIDRETCEGCFYAIPRDGKTITGPSARMAEIALAAWGNAVAEADIVDEDRNYIYALGMCRDLERNTAIRVKVRRRITNREGKRFSDDMIAVTANAVCSIALRNAVLKIVPAAYVKPVVAKCMRIAGGDAKTIETRRAEILTRLGKMGITEDRALYAVRRRSVEEITAADLQKLIGFGQAIHEGEADIDEVFPPPPKEKSAPTNGVGAVKAAMRNGGNGNGEPTPEPEPEEVDDEIPFGTDEDGGEAAPQPAGRVNLFEDE